MNRVTELKPTPPKPPHYPPPAQDPRAKKLARLLGNYTVQIVGETVSVFGLEQVLRLEFLESPSYKKQCEFERFLIACNKLKLKQIRLWRRNASMPETYPIVSRSSQWWGIVPDWVP
jgi:hypothetical protein